MVNSALDAFLGAGHSLWKSGVLMLQDLPLRAPSARGLVECCQQPVPTFRDIFEAKFYSMKPRVERVTSNQPALLHGCLDERGKKRMRLEGTRFQLGVELHAHKPGMAGDFDDLGQ